LKKEKETKKETDETLNLGELLAIEKKHIRNRRKERGETDDLINDSLGIALSGGGIRSATICLGIVEKLNEVRLLEKTDYLSSVSGGGYLAAYIHSALNQEDPVSYSKLFDKEEVVEHLRRHRTHLYKWPDHKFFSIIYLVFSFLSAILLNWLWLILPAIYCTYYKVGSNWDYVILVLLILLPAITLSPNWTSLHRYYKNRLRNAYLRKNGHVKLKDLTNSAAPYPLINSTVHVRKDDYSNSKSVTYRGQINSNYFLFSPLYCGSQVTHYVRTDKSVFSAFSLATAMATSGAALNTFMGNVKINGALRLLISVLNLKTGILAPSPLRTWKGPVFYPYQTVSEALGMAKTTSYRIQISDGGHIENLAVYELFRRKVKTIIAIDGGQDSKFDFSDLRNLIIRARHELGVIITFDEENNPAQTMKPDLVNGVSQSYFAVAKISGMKDSYAQGYEGVFIYVKSTLLPSQEFKLRDLKNRLQSIKAGEIEGDFDLERRKLDSTMYSTYNPDFPHETTSDQFFEEAQWDSYYKLGGKIGDKLITSLDLKAEDTRVEIFEKISGEKS